MSLQEIVQIFGAEYARTHSLLPVQHKALRSIRDCRTAALGGHVDHFDCGHVHVSYNSCRNRNCPKCQTLAKERWVMARMEDLLPVPYHHVVFTLPEELNRLVFINSSVLYNLLMKTAAQTVAELCASKKYLGVQTGVISVLHTWGQNLTLHPHVHMIVPAGGLTSDGKFRIGSKMFFIPVKGMAKKFRGKFLWGLKKLRNQFVSPNLNGFVAEQKSQSSLMHPNLQRLIDLLYTKDWYVYCKRPFKSSASVLRYLGRYTHRVAISNNRIVSIDDDNVSFLYRDYKNGGKSGVMTLHGSEFLRRFLLHVLPSGFRKIRYYGFLASAAKAKKLRLCKILLGVKHSDAAVSLSTRDLMMKVTGVDITVCPVCFKGKLLFSSGLHPPLCG